MHFPFTGEPYKPQMGLFPLDLNDWIEVDEHQASRLERKRELLQKERDTVLRILPESHEAVLELRRILRGHLLAVHPDHYSESDAGFLVKDTGRVFPEPDSAPEALEQIAQWTQEDWCVLSPRPPVRLIAGAVCFPSRWSLKDKIGRDSDAIHGPVPKFKESIGRPTAGFLERMSVDKPMWRLNWTIHDSDELFCPGPHPGRTDLTESNVLEHTFLRMERQTLRRLPGTQAVVFSIRNHVHPLKEVLKDPERRRLLKESLLGLPEETADYKGMRHFFGLLKKAL
ncbi:MAG: DUF3445 domain-containing protein [Bdellovibrionaceae bacterium]|nr:DUF3445 domain-containing protein [Pseudobdellovibrionaceae bacterium]MBX3033792.1 DUF3445 domain-containing protein [Pseudobdellovibrionaceae bacterium]